MRLSRDMIFMSTTLSKLADHSRNSERDLFEILPQLIRLIRISLKKNCRFLDSSWRIVPFIMTSSRWKSFSFPCSQIVFLSFLSPSFPFLFFFCFFPLMAGHVMRDESTWLFLISPPLSGEET